MGGESMDSVQLNSISLDDKLFKVTNVYGSILEISNGNITKRVQRLELQKLNNDMSICLYVPTYKCVRKIRDKSGRIQGYILVDLYKKTRQVSAERLKAAIYNYQANVVNLKLTKDNRLVDTDGDVSHRNLFRSRYRHIELTRYRVEQIMNLLVNAQKSLRKPKMELEIQGNYDGRDRGKWKNLGNTGLMAQIKSVGNSVIMSVRPLEGCKISFPQNSDLLFVNRHTISYGSNEKFLKFVELRLVGIDWSKVTSARKMLYCTKIQSLVIEDQQAAKLEDAEQFLQLSEVSKVDFDNFQLMNLKNASKMFSGCVNLSYDNMELGDMNIEATKNIHQMFGIPYTASKTGKRFEATSEFIDCAGGLKGILSGKFDVRIKLYPDDSIDTENLSKFEKLCMAIGRKEYAENLKDELAYEKMKEAEAREESKSTYCGVMGYDQLLDPESYYDCDYFDPSDCDYLLDDYYNEIQGDAISIGSDTCIKVEELSKQ